MSGTNGAGLASHDSYRHASEHWIFRPFRCSNFRSSFASRKVEISGVHRRQKFSEEALRAKFMSQPRDQAVPKRETGRLMQGSPVCGIEPGFIPSRVNDTPGADRCRVDRCCRTPDMTAIDHSTTPRARSSPHSAVEAPPDMRGRADRHTDGYSSRGFRSGTAVRFRPDPDLGADGWPRSARRLAPRWRCSVRSRSPMLQFSSSYVSKKSPPRRRNHQAPCWFRVSTPAAMNPKELKYMATAL